MGYLSIHGSKRSQPKELIPGTERVICFRLDYLPDGASPREIIASDQQAYIARYSLGRDYHKVIRQKLKRIWQKIEAYLEEHNLPAAQGRVFTDSAPVLEKALAQKAGLGWIGKNTLMLNRDAGSWFFLGEIYTSIPLPIDAATTDQHCGTCSACIDVCPTAAFTGPYELDARKCISYLTIEHRGSIDPTLRSAIGNRIFGCDDCQVFCPWNKFANFTSEPDFTPRHNLDDTDLLSLFAWTETEFLNRTEGSAIRRTGYQGWQRNIAVALGNADYRTEIIAALGNALGKADELVAEHIDWAIKQQNLKKMGS
jgi:epoxyqueuosine reductase